jgi:hypothetical protein
MVDNKTLTDIIYQYKNTTFSWGEFDCCIFTVKVVEEFTNRNLPYWKEIINYKDRKGSMKALAKIGCKELKDLPNVILGNPIKSIEKVKLGEPVYLTREDTGEGLLGICNGTRAYFVNRPVGITARKIEECEFCWSID